MRSKPLFAILLCVSGLPTVVQAADRPEASVQFGLQNFSWSEFNNTGAKLLEENGARFTIGAALDNFQHEGSGFLYNVNGKIYLGVVDYDGQTQSGVPVMTDVTYFGLNIEALGGYRFGRRIGVDVFGGLGVDDWVRSLADSTAVNGTTAFGYDENYSIVYGKAGVGFFQLLSGWRYLVQAGVKMPLYATEYVNLGSGVDLEPGLKPSAFANLQFDFGSGRHNRFGVSLYYDSYRFSESDPELLIEGGSAALVVQPRSQMDVYGLRLSYYFL